MLGHVPYIWVNYNDLTVLPHWNHWFMREIIPFYGQTIQVSEFSELFYFTQIYGAYGVTIVNPPSPLVPPPLENLNRALIRP